MTISAWSMSRLDVFESCPFRAQLQYIEKIPEPDRGPPPKGEWPNDRGSRVHKSAEDYVRGETDVMIPELRNFADEVEHLRALYGEGKVVLEDGWAFDKDWNPVAYDDYDNIWCRFIIDALVFDGNNRAIAIDYKTGKRFYNEIKHGKQMQAYQLATFLRYPDIEAVVAELWYLDQNELCPMTFTRDQGLRFFNAYDRRGRNLTEATEFPAKPNARTCFFCPYKTGTIGKTGVNGTGHCSKNP